MELLKDQDLATLIHANIADAHHDADQAILARRCGANRDATRGLKLFIMSVMTAVGITWVWFAA
jgi:hypothetical protein